MPTAYVGVSGWRYPRWRGDFYPQGLVQRRELEYVASRMTSAEINGSFYSLQRPSTYRGFVEQTPEEFVLAVKGSRFITHLKRLADVEAGLANFFASGVLALGRRLGPVLWQLPPTLRYDEDLVADFLAALPRSTREAGRLARGHDGRLSGDRVLLEAPVDVPLRHAFEARHPSFFTDDAVAVLAAHEAALVLSDSPGKWPFVERRTTDFMYARLHGHTELYASGYAPASLDAWADRVRAWLADGRDAYVYFDNDARGRAPWDAVGLLERLGS